MFVFVLALELKSADSAACFVVIKPPMGGPNGRGTQSFPRPSNLRKEIKFFWNETLFPWSSNLRKQSQIFWNEIKQVAGHPENEFCNTCVSKFRFFGTKLSRLEDTQRKTYSLNKDLRRESKQCWSEEFLHRPRILRKKSTSLGYETNIV